jgi:hypothetical protein
MYSLKIKIEIPEIFGKIDLSKIDSNTRPKGMTQQQIKRAIKLRDKLDSGWGWSFRQLVKNHKRHKK